jgi:hypothetical protein
VESAHVKRYWRGKAYTHGCSAIFLLSLGASTVFSYDTIIITQGRVAGSSSGKVARDGGGSCRVLRRARRQVSAGLEV